MKRRVVQITGVQDSVAAFCDDGSVWLLTIPFEANFEDREWACAPDIPQPPPRVTFEPTRKVR
jgi:hypothetical protein